MIKTLFYSLKFQWETYFNRKAYANKPQEYDYVVTQDALSKFSDGMVENLKKGFSKIRAKSLDYNIFFDCNDNSLYTIVDRKRYDLSFTVTYDTNSKYRRIGGIEYFNKKRIITVQLAKLFGFTISSDLNAGFLTVTLPNGRSKLYPLNCNINAIQNLKTIIVKENNDSYSNYSASSKFV